MRSLFRRCAFLLFAIASALAAAEPADALPVHRLSIREGGRLLNLTLVLFDADRHRLRVIDNLGTDGRPRYADLREAMRSERCLAGCNGGFFHRTPFAPVGYMVAGGRPTGTFDAGLWMKGLVVVRSERLTLEATAGFAPSDPTVTELLQSGPWLVRSGLPQADNDRARHAPRTFIGHGPGGIWFMGASDSCSLHELSAFLRHRTVREVVSVENALNLDGGPSTGLWARAEGFDFYRSEDWTVRNYLGVAPR